jgi:hypothetical protein
MSAYTVCEDCHAAALAGTSELAPECGHAGDACVAYDGHGYPYCRGEDYSDVSCEWCGSGRAGRREHVTGPDRYPIGARVIVRTDLGPEAATVTSVTRSVFPGDPTIVRVQFDDGTMSGWLAHHIQPNHNNKENNPK